MSPFPAILQSDNEIKDGWYRFNGGQNSQVMETICIKKYGKCGTLLPGWMKGDHPTGAIILSNCPYNIIAFRLYTTSSILTMKLLKIIVLRHLRDS